MARSTYVIDDEPVPGTTLAKTIVDPLYPLMAVMLAGTWLGWPWLLLNARALGSPSWRRQAGLLALGLAGTALLALVIVALVNADIITTRTHVRLAMLVVIVWKLGISYKVHALQAGTYQLYRHYHGEARYGLRLVALGVFARAVVLGLVDSILWIIIVSGVLWNV